VQQYNDIIAAIGIILWGWGRECYYPRVIFWRARQYTFPLSTPTRVTAETCRGGGGIISNRQFLDSVSD